MSKKTFINLEKTSSTNAFMLEMPEDERVDTVVLAREQTAGKGMGSNVWESAPGLNLTFSMGADLSFMKAENQFLLSQAVPLGLLDVLDAMLPSEFLTVKWPNDLYFKSQKLCGILINSTIRGMAMGTSVIGIGLNVNQMHFQEWPTHPVSMKMILGQDVALNPLLRQLVEAVDRRVAMLRTSMGMSEIKTFYLKRLYRYRMWADYKADGLKVRRFITGIDPFGRLETLDDAGERHVYDIKQLKFL